MIRRFLSKIKVFFACRGYKSGLLPIKARICVLPLIHYDDKTDSIDYGQCYSVDMTSISTNSITVRHNNILKKGNILEFRTKHALEDVACLKCANFKTLSESPSFSSFIGKVLWRTDEEAGINIMMMKDQDKVTIAKMIASNNSLLK